MTFDATTIAMLKTGIWETFYMVALSSFLAYLIGLPLGVEVQTVLWSGYKKGCYLLLPDP